MSMSFYTLETLTTMQREALLAEAVHHRLCASASQAHRVRETQSILAPQIGGALQWLGARRARAVAVGVTARLWINAAMHLLRCSSRPRGDATMVTQPETGLIASTMGTNPRI